MATATQTKPKTTTTQSLQKPIVCHRCTATHFAYQLTCKRCGDYLDKKDRPISETNLGAVKLACAAVATMVGLAMVCIALHII
jgi:uncharacterized paraquat-inducible protein A